MGFRIDETGAKKFKAGLSDTTKDALKLGGAVIGVGLAIEAFVENMANALAKLFYISERSGATVAGLKATESAFQGIGLQAGVATQAIESVGDALRKPFLAARLRGFGIDVNQPTEKVASDLEHKLAAMWNAPGGAGRQPAENLAKDLLGMNEHDFVQLVKELPELDKQMAIAAERIKETGQNYQTAARDAAEFNRQLGVIGQDISAMAAKWLGLNTYMRNVVETAEDFEDVLHKALTGDWKHLLSGPDRAIHLRKDAMQGEQGQGGINFGRGTEHYGNQGSNRNDLINVARDAAKQYGLEAATLIGQIQTESGFDPSARSGAGAVGVSQWLPETARGRGFEAGKDPAEDIRQTAKWLAELRDHFNGDMRHALEAYHAGVAGEDLYLSGASQFKSGVGPKTLAYPNTVANYAEQYRLGTGSFAGLSSDWRTRRWVERLRAPGD